MIMFKIYFCKILKHHYFFYYLSTYILNIFKTWFYRKQRCTTNKHNHTNNKTYLDIKLLKTNTFSKDECTLMSIHQIILFGLQTHLTCINIDNI